MGFNVFTENDAKILRAFSDRLPVIMHQTCEVHFMTGAELLEMGYVEHEGEVIDKEQDYRYNQPVQIAANHYRRLKRAWLKDGQPGVLRYLKTIKQTVDQFKDEQSRN